MCNLSSREATVLRHPANRELLGDSILLAKDGHQLHADRRRRRDPSTDLIKLLLICCWLQNLPEAMREDSDPRRVTFDP